MSKFNALATLLQREALDHAPDPGEIVRLILSAEEAIDQLSAAVDNLVEEAPSPAQWDRYKPGGGGT
jgi:hypothetical protein